MRITIRWGLTSTNPVTNSEPPRVNKRYGVALTVARTELVLQSATEFWCTAPFLGLSTRSARGAVRF